MKQVDFSAPLAGALAGGIEAICVWPTENVKTQLQLQGKVANPKFTSFSSGVAYIAKNQGVRGLYTGLVPILIGALPKAGIKFGSNAFFNKKLRELPLHRSVVDFSAGLCAGALEAVMVAVPVETIKTKTIEMNCGFVEGSKRTLAESGIRGFYKGVLPTILKQSSNQGLRFMFMGRYREIITNSGEKKITPIQSLVGGMGAGCFSALGNNPFDVIKTKMQGVDSGKRYSGSVDCALKIFQNEGLAGFYSGLFPRLYRVVPGQGIIFMSYDMLLPLISTRLN